MMNRRYKYIGLLACLILGGCQDKEDLALNSDMIPAQYIQIGGVDTDELVAAVAATRGDGDPVVNEEEVQLTDAENISWLVAPLTNGLDITYGKEGNPRTHERVAVLRLLTNSNGTIKYSEGNLAEYSFNYRHDTNGTETTDPARWYDNGAHYFEGLYIPAKIKYRNEEVVVYDDDDPPHVIKTLPAQTLSDVYGENGSAPNLNTDQHDDNTNESKLGNYTLLSRYLGMPSNFTLNATVARVKLPFRHRLARVLAYILIDPDMGDNVTIQGYKKANDGVTDAAKEDPTNSKIRFCNVKVLEGVKDSYNSETKHHTYIPQWKEKRKVIPHFVGERGSYDDSNNTSLDNDDFIAYYDTQKKEYIYPTDAAWKTIRASQSFPDGKKTMTENGAYERTIYGKVPVYDLIVQPTYTSLNRVMYDEEGVEDANTKQALYVAKNKIDFEITLKNGLNYTKEFIFDLDANYQTVVYLRISRERVDYNSSGSDRWVETIGYDDYYGVNNQNGNTLSYAGSSWQRAYTYGTTPAGTEHPNPFTDVVTDGHFYTNDSENENAQYVTQSKLIEMLREACVGGKHHGDYFILHDNISIPADAFPADFVFTGHLDGLDHTITLTDAKYTPAHDEYEPYDDASYTKYIKTSGDNYEVFTPDANATYCDNSGNYNVIADINSYSGSTAYIRTVASPTYEVVPVGSDFTSGTFYKHENNAYVEIVNMSDYLSSFSGAIYTKNAPTYSEVSSVENLQSEVTYYQNNNGNYVQVTIGPFYIKNPDSYTEVTDREYLDPDITYYKLEGDNYVVIQFNEINSYEGTIYTKDVATYTEVPIGNLFSSGTTYYYLNGTDEYVKIDDISTYIGTVYTKTPDSYEVVAVGNLVSSGTTYYYKDSSDNFVPIADINTYIGIYREVINYDYEPITFYKFVHYEPVIGSSTGASSRHLFAGLNGKYSTRQESDATATWEANVHREIKDGKTYWVPYTNGTDGWRAEIINTNINGGTVFPATVTYGTEVTGYVHNCWEGSTYNSETHKWSGGNKVTDYTPSIPEY